MFKASAFIIITMSQSNKKTVATPKTRGRKKKESIIPEEEPVEEETIQIKSTTKKAAVPSKSEQEEKIIVNDDEEDFEDIPEVKVPSRRGRKPLNKPTAAGGNAKTTPVKPKENKQFHIILDSITPEIDIEKLSKTGGRFVGKIPNQAARKAFGKIAKIHSVNDPDEKIPCVYQFSIQEYKNSGDGKEKIYSYEGTRTKLSEPKIIKSGETEYKVRYKTDLKSLRGRAPKKTP